MESGPSVRYAGEASARSEADLAWIGQLKWSIWTRLDAAEGPDGSISAAVAVLSRVIGSSKLSPAARAASTAILRDFYGQNKSAFWAIVLTGNLINLLIFFSSLYIMLLYDLVLPSGSTATLASLFIVVVVIHVFQAIFEMLRARAGLTLAMALDGSLDMGVQRSLASAPLSEDNERDPLQVSRGQDQVFAYTSSAGPLSLLDLPWTVLFLGALSLMHLWLGLTVLLGIFVLSALSYAASVLTRRGNETLAAAASERSAQISAVLRLAGPAKALGMRGRLIERSVTSARAFRCQQGAILATAGQFGSAGRVFRAFLQSAILTVGALLTLEGMASGGIVFAASVLAGRALAPIDQTIGAWRSLVAAKSGWQAVMEAIAGLPAGTGPKMTLALPSERIDIRDLWLVPPGQRHAVLRGINLTLSRGEAWAVIGPSGAGKSTLIKAVLGIWHGQRGEIRLDGARHDQWDADELGRAFGYVPQSIELIDGTVGENICRFEPEATSEKIVEAARKAGLHDTILSLENGYDTRIAAGQVTLSAGQIQWLGLARALYGKPFILALDEAGSNLDGIGELALERAIAEHRASGGIVLAVTHRPSTLAPMSHVLILRNGSVSAAGERDETLASAGLQPPFMGAALGRPRAVPK